MGSSKSLLTGVLFLTFTLCHFLWSAGEGPPGKKLIVSVDKINVKYDRSSQEAVINFTGTTVNLPPGVKITFKLLYNYFEVGSAVGKVNSDATVGPVTIKPTCPLPPDDVYEINMEISAEKQEPALKKQVEKLLESSEYSPFVKRFTIGTAEDKKKNEEEVRKFIKKILSEAVALNNEYISEVEAAEKKIKYQGSDGFDTSAWRAYVDKKWRPRMIKLQKRFDSWLKKYPAYRYRYGAGVIHMEDMLRTIAWRSVNRSRKLYKAFQKKLALEDLSPPREMKINPAYRRVRTDKGALRYLGRCYQVVREAFGLIPPPQKKEEKKKEKEKEKGS